MQESLGKHFLRELLRFARDIPHKIIIEDEPRLL
jgi:hypothetical protein